MKTPTRWPFDIAARLALGAAFLCLALPASALDFPPVLRRDATLYMVHSGGDFAMSILKRDLNIYDGEDAMVARLTGPGWIDMGRIDIPDDGKLKRGEGPQKEPTTQSIEIADAPPGVYQLTVRPGGRHDMAWGFETNASRLMIESELAFSDASYGGTIYLRPTNREQRFTARALHKVPQTLVIHDAAGKERKRIVLDERGEKIEWALPATKEAGGMWSVQSDTLDYALDSRQPVQWTVASGAGFWLAGARWVLTPGRFRSFVRPGQSKTVEFEIRNPSSRPQNFRIEVSGDTRYGSLESDASLALEGIETRPVRIRVRAPESVSPGDTARCWVRVTSDSPEVVASSAALDVTVGAAPAESPVDLPIRLGYYRHENIQFGYEPDFVRNAVFFDLENRPYIRVRSRDNDDGNAVQFFEEDKWRETSFVPALKKKYPGFRRTVLAAGWEGTKTVFDAQGGAYTVVRIAVVADGKARAFPVLLYSPDAFRTEDAVQVYELPQARNGEGPKFGGNFATQFDIEQFTGHNAHGGPPPISLWFRTKEHPARFGDYYDMVALFPQKRAGRLELGEQVFISDNSVGQCRHSGGASPSVTHNGKTHFTWFEMSGDDVPGVPTYVATCDHATGKLGKPVFIAHGAPVNDVHNTPGITIDSEGYLHVISGAHNQPFYHRRSLKPNDAYSGWTDVVPMVTTGRINRLYPAPGIGAQTYLALVCDPDGNLHTAYRRNLSGGDLFGGQSSLVLTYQRKPRGKRWDEPRHMVLPPGPGYSGYYHKLTIDRLGRLFLSYSYYRQDEYRHALPGLYDNRAVLMSKDRGETWSFARTQDFIEGRRKE